MNGCFLSQIAGFGFGGFGDTGRDRVGGLL